MASINTRNDQRHEEYQEYSKIVEKFTGMCLNNSPLKQSEVVMIDKMAPSKFFQVQFKNFDQQQHLTKKAFKFCMSKNADEIDEVTAAIEEFRKPSSRKTHKKPKKRKVKVRFEDDDNDPDYKPRNHRIIDENIQNNKYWSRQLDEQEEHVNEVSMEAFVSEMLKDKHVADPNSISLIEEKPVLDTFEQSDQSEFQPVDDFGSEEPYEIERQLLQGVPEDIRHTLVPIFSQNSNFFYTVPQVELEIPVINPLRISPMRRDMQIRTDLSMQDIENAVVPQLESRKQRTSQSPRQPLINLDLNTKSQQGPNVVESIDIQVPEQIPVLPVNEVIESVPIPQQEINVGQEVVQQEQTPVEKLIIPEEVDIAASVRRPRRRRRVQVSVSPEEHEVRNHRKLICKRSKNCRLIDEDLSETDESLWPVSMSMDHLVQVDTMHLTDTIDDFLSPKPDPPPISQRSSPIILCPSGAQQAQPNLRRTSSMIHEIQQSQVPIDSAVMNVYNESRRMFDSAVMNTQRVNDHLSQIQRKIGKTPPQIPLDPNEINYEIPTMSQIQQLHEGSMIARFEKSLKERYSIARGIAHSTPIRTQVESPAIQNIAPVLEKRGSDLTVKEKFKLEVFFDLLTLVVSIGKTELTLLEVFAEDDRENRARKFVIFLGLQREQPQMVKLIKNLTTNIVTHIALVGF